MRMSQNSLRIFKLKSLPCSLGRIFSGTRFFMQISLLYYSTATRANTMGTHSYIKVIYADRKGQRSCYALIFTHYDGFLVGRELAKLLEGMKIVQGQPMNDKEVNGAGELGLKLFQFFQNRTCIPDSVYLEDIESDWEYKTEEYTFEVVVTQTYNYQFKITINGALPAKLAVLHEDSLSDES